MAGDLDLATFGQRLRHLRRARGLTLVQLGEQVGQAPSQLSLLENGKREPKLSLIAGIAKALQVPVDELLASEAPSRRAQLEIELEEAQRDPVYRSLELPYLKVGKRVPTEVLEHVLGLYEELKRRDTKPTATPEEARLANRDLRLAMREQDNYFPEIERVAVSVLESVGYRAGALSEGLVVAMVSRNGFALRYVQDLPRSVRSVTDLRNRRIYLRRESLGMHTPRTILLQTLGHFLLGHAQPRDFADFLRQRVEANYFAAAVLVPERSAADFLQQAKASRDLALEDLRDVYAVSYEMAAHRFTNLATRYLDLRCHFVRNDESGIIYKAYENDGLAFPADSSGAIEGQRMCRFWAGRQVFASPDRYSSFHQYTDTPGGTHWCVAHVDPGGERHFAVTLGVPFKESKWFRGRETTQRATSRCPSGQCCSRPPAELASRWEGNAWPSARAHSHVLAALPPGTFPGVDETDVYTFLDRHADV
ncbi:XRE family transcriptional regulator [Tenggerimyces flavus]|uniref:Helix-turn-helix domain-containing protein n=1 Tax=Tenggerimyces flavus TaxID=1708749 RepID=A0ABV7YF43_9ACTN|nr:XRE family transcriptional regulator [Tenggerimyces flavus]MBM7791307.1 transcriptional regulator with XRE-family HTH domain/predicted transcriptional regulator [Tenggerimyces flavus]